MNALQAGARLLAWTRSTPRSSISCARRRALARTVRAFLLATKANDLAAAIGDGGCQSVAFGGNESRGAHTRERLRDLDGRLLAASGIEARHDLQYGRLLHGTRFLK